MPSFQSNNLITAIFPIDPSLKSQLARGAGGAFAVKIAAMGSAFLLQVILARILGLEGFGIYIYALTLMNFAAMFGRLGMDTASVKCVAAYHGTNDWAKLSGFISFSNTLSLSLGLLVGVASVAVFYVIDVPEKHSLIKPIWIACLLLTPLNALIFTINAQLRGFKCIVPSQSANDVLRPLFIILTIAILYYAAKDKVSASVALCVHALSATVVLTIMIILLKKYIDLKPKEVRPIYEYRHWVLSALPFLGIAVANLVIAQADILMLGSLGSPTEAGLYAPARRIGNLITIVLTSVNAIAAPLFSELYTQGKKDELQNTVRTAAKWIFLFSVPCCILVMIFAKPLLLLFGTEFQKGYQALQIIAGAQLVNALAGSVGFLLMMTNHQSKASLIMMVCALLNLSLNFFLIPHFGIIGAAWSNFLTTVF